MVVERNHSTGVLLQFFLQCTQVLFPKYARCLSATVSPVGNDEITSPDFHRQEEHAYIQAEDPNVYNKQNLKQPQRTLYLFLKLQLNDKNRSNQYLFECFLKK